VHLLVYFEETNDVESAIKREKQIKAWKRGWKIELIEKTNPDWNDLYEEILDSESSSE
jgi:putative endonuclease